MAVSIDDLQVETQTPAASAGAPTQSAAPQSKPDFKGEMEKLRERHLRLRAD
jgi:hypothetical protein